jgi:tetratricopeptide (TPR) repeat protein
LDPQNPIYRLNLGGVFYSLNNWDEASNLFTQAVGLKSDWPNAYYNLAWASYQKGAYQQAVNAMQNTISLLDPKTSKTDYEKASKELEEFKKKLPPAEEEATQGAQTKPSQLTLPTPQPTIEPKIKLPKEASPEAK